MMDTVSLNPAQQQAVRHTDGPLLILAGPGSGKTRVVTHRIAHMVQQGIDPHSILALTFTNKAADEMQSRVRRLVPAAGVWVSTFHRFCSQLLRRNARLVGLDSNFTIYDASDSRRALVRAIDSVPTPPTLTTPDAILNRISWLKNQMVTADQYEPGNDVLSPILTKVYPAYQKELLRSNAVDFDDLLLHVVSLLRGSAELRAAMDERYRYVMVDEYQDTNLAQYAIVRAISNEFPNLAVTGDPDQSIYGWRGANLRNILDFEHDYPDVTVVRLEENYRSTPNILSAAQSLIANNVQRKAKELYTSNAPGGAVRLAYFGTNTEEAEAIVDEIAALIRSGKQQPSDVAIFYRTNALSRSFEHALHAQGIPFQIVNGVEFYQRKEVKDLLAYLQLINNPQDNNALTRVINVPPRRIGKTTLKRLEVHAREHNLPMLDAARQCDGIESISKTIGGRLREFVELVDDISQAAGPSLEAMLGLVLTATGYRDFLAESPQPDDQDRVANIDELLQAARAFDQRNADPDAIGAFLEQAALVNDTDSLGDGRHGVTLMTLHSAKGLEFPVVYIVGVEQGLLPHDRSKDDPAQLEEERRLLFVGITRAERRLQISMASKRPFRGSMKRSIQSQFLVELPRSEMEQLGDPRNVSRAYEGADPYSQAPAHGYEEPTFDVRDEARDFDQVPDEDDVFGETQIVASEDESQDPDDARVSPTRPRLPLQTASQMMAGQETEEVDAEETSVAVDPEQFELGMTVLHPKYGPGKIAALSDGRDGRQAIVNFATVGRITVILAYSDLRPA